MRILIISQYFPPDITAAAFRSHDMAKLLSKSGHEVHVITARPHRTLAKGTEFKEIELESGKVFRSKIMKLGSGGVINYLKHYISFMLTSTWQGFKQRLAGWKPDVIWASSPPLFVGLSGCFLSKLLRCPMVLDVRDIWPDSAVAAGQISSNGRAYKIGKLMEKYIYKRARHITCVAEPMREYILTQTDRHVSIVYNGVLEQPENTEVLDKYVTTNGKKEILYAGNLGRVQQIDLLIQGYAELIGEGHVNDWTIRLLGDGAMGEQLKSLIQQLGVEDKVLIEPVVTHQQCQRRLEDSDLLFISLRPEKVLEMTIPSKVFDYMLAGRPILAGISGQGKEILNSTGSNVCYNPGELKALKEGLKKATSQCDQLTTSAHKNRELVLSKFTRQEGLKVLTNIFNTL